jgi:hypothetical protein
LADDPPLPVTLARPAATSWQSIAYVYRRETEVEARQANVLTKDVARRIAVAGLPELHHGSQPKGPPFPRTTPSPWLASGVQIISVWHLTHSKTRTRGDWSPSLTRTCLIIHLHIGHVGRRTIDMRRRSLFLSGSDAAAKLGCAW